MATGQPGLSTPDGRSLESQSAQRMGECTRGCGTDGWLSERARAREGWTVGSGVYILSSLALAASRFVSPIPGQGCVYKHKAASRSLPQAHNSQFSHGVFAYIRATKSRHTGNIFMSLTHQSVFARRLFFLVCKILSLSFAYPSLIISV